MELLTEFYEDLYEKDKQAMYDDAKDDNGHYVFESTGDALIDKWERELAQGLEPDLTDGMDEVAKTRMARERNLTSKAKRQLEELGSADGLLYEPPNTMTKGMILGED